MSEEYQSFIELLVQANKRLDMIEENILQLNALCDRIERRRLQMNTETG